MTIGSALQKLRTSLSTIYEKDEGRIIALNILEKLTGIPRNTLQFHEQETLSDAQSEQFESYTSLLMQHMPLQQVIEEAWFYERPFYINKQVLIPRPETEELVSVALKELSLFEKPDILDIGTGSGVIPITLKLHIPEARIVAIDISEEALKVAQKNAENHQAKIEFKKVDFLKDKDAVPGVYDLIISNPPYIAASEKTTMANHVVEHEPHLALFVPDGDPLIFYRNIAVYATKHLRRFGRVIVEINERFGEETAEVFKQQGFKVVIVQDMSGKNRMLMAWFKDSLNLPET